MMFNYCPSCGHKGSVKELDKTNYECEDCLWHFWNNSKAAVALVFIQDRQVLLAKRAIEPRKGGYSLVGGFTNYAEGAYAAAIREAAEETSVRIKPEDLELIGTHDNGYIPGIHVVGILFLVHAWEGNFIPDDDAAALEWKPFGFLDRPPLDTIYPGLADLLKQRFPKEAPDELQ